MSNTTVYLEKLAGYPALVNYCKLRSDRQLTVTQKAFYFPDETGRITSTCGGHRPVPAGMDVGILCDELNALVKELGIELIDKHTYWLSSSTNNSELNGKLWDEKGKEIPKGFAEYLKEVPIKKVGYASMWGVYFTGGSYYVHPINSTVDYINVEGEMRPSLIVEPVYMQESQVTCVEVKNLLKNAYNQGVANTTQKLYDTLQNGGF